MRSFSLGQSSQAGQDIPRVLSALVTEGSRELNWYCNILPSIMTQKYRGYTALLSCRIPE